jgi:WD40 repeat protein
MSPTIGPSWGYRRGCILLALASAIVIFVCLILYYWIRYAVKPSPNITSFAGTHSGLSCVALASNDELLVTGDSKGIVKCWSIRDASCISSTAGHTAEITALAFSSDNKLVASADIDGHVIVWDLEGWRKVTEITRLPHAGALTFLQDSAALLVGLIDQSVLQVTIATGNVTQVLPPAGSLLVGFAHVRGGKDIITVDTGGSFRRRGVAEAKNKLPMLPSADLIAFAASSQTTSIACGDTSGKVYVCDSQSCNTTQVLSGHDGGVAALSFSPDDAFLVSAGRDRKVVVWDYVRGSQLLVFQGDAHMAATHCLVLRDRTLVLCFADGEIKRVILPPGQ